MKNKLLLLLTAFAFLSTQAQTFNSTLETSYGGNRADRISDIKKAENGSVFVAGSFGGTVDFDLGPAIFNLTANGAPASNNTYTGLNGYIQKFNSSGNLDWAIANITGDSMSSSFVQQMAITPSGDIYTTSRIKSHIDVDPGPGFVSIPPGRNFGYNSVIQKLNGTTGALEWAISVDAHFLIDVDQNGDVLISGRYNDRVDLDPGTGTFWMDPLANNSYAPFAAKYSGVDGSFLWGADFDFAATGAMINDIDVDKNTGRLILCGWYRNQIWVNPGAPLGSHIIYTGPNQNDIQGFMVILNSDGSHHFSQNFGHQSGNWSSETYSVDFDDVSNYYIGTSEPSVSTFWTHRFRKYSPNHTSLFSEEINMSNFSIEAQGNGEVFLHGKLSPNGSTDIDPSSTFFSPNHPSESYVIMKWNANTSPSLDWYKHITDQFGPYNTVLHIDVDANENHYIGASFVDTIIPNISSTDSFIVTNCTPNIPSQCYDVYLNFGSVCSDTTFVNTNLNVCSGSNYTFSDGTTYNNIMANFSHTAYITNAGGCDSAVTYAVQAVSYPITYDTAYVCSGDSYTFPNGSSVVITGVGTSNTTLISSLGCDSTVVTHVYAETAPSISGEISCTGDSVIITVTDMGTYQGNPAPPFDIRNESQTITILISGVGTYSYPITDNLLSTRIFQFEANNCAQPLLLYNACDQSICAGNDTSNLLNGDFENGTTNWTQFEAFLDSTNSGSSPINAQALGNNRAYNYSTTSAWFGGWNQGSYSSISQDVIIDAGASATLEWWQRQQNDCAADDVLTVLIDGDTIFELHADQDPHCGNFGAIPWNFKSVDVSSYADGMTHNVMFHYTQQGTNGYTNLFIDNIELYTCAAPLVQMDLPVTFDDPMVYYATSDFGGNASIFVNDPTGGTNQVVQTTKSNTAQVWAGTSLNAFTPSAFLNAVPFTATETVMSVRVYSPDAGIPVLLKVEDKTNGAISVETEVMTTMANTWETLYFDFNNHASGTPALNLANTYDLATIFFNFGTTGASAGTKIYYWDDVQMDSIACPTVTTSFNDTICFFDSYTFPDGNTLTWQQLPQDTTYETSFSTGNGCFGTAYTIVHKRPNSVGVVMFPNVCFGSNYTYPDGFTHTNIQSNVGHASVLTNQFGCDSNQLQILQVQPVYTFYDTTILCAGADYTAPDGTLYSNVQTTFDHTSSLSTAYGCDSTHQSTVEVLPSYTLYTIDTICYNDSYIFPNGFTANNIQSFYHYWIPMTAQNGCDSTMTFDLYVRPNSQGANTTHTVCSGDDFTYQDGVVEMNITSNKVHLNTFTNQYGCDSTFIQFINTVNPVYNFTQSITICFGTNYTALDGTFYGNIQADFSHTSSFTTVNGCDSNYLVTIQVAPDYTTNSYDTICYNDSYTFPDGNTLNNLQADTLYVIPFTTWQGACDSSIYVNLHVRPLDDSPINYTVCSGDDFTFLDGTVAANMTTSQTYLNMYTNQFGCDSTVTQIVAVQTTYSFNDTVNVCLGTDFTAYDGTVYNNIQTAFNHTSSFNTQNNCDSTYVTQINLLPTYTSTSLDTICFDDSYTFPDGNTLNNLQEDTLYVISNTTQNGCDSLVSVDLVVRQNSQGINTAHTVCSGGNFTFSDGNTLNNLQNDTLYLNTFTNINGCDSTFTQDLTVNPIYSFNDTLALCAGSDYTAPDGTFFGNIQATFNHTSSLVTQNNCDSIYETVIEVSPTFTINTNDTICFDESYTFPDGNTLNNIQIDTLYVISSMTQNGCDSSISIDLYVKPQIALINLSYSICSGASFTYIDGTVSNNITAPESYTNTFTASNGCDSLVTENVGLNPSYFAQDSFDVCFGDDFTFADGTILTISNDFTYTSNLTIVGSCDSIVETKINVIGLGGTIQSSAATPLSNSKVYLIEHLPGQDYLFIQDSTTTNANGEYYFAEGDPNHYIKAIPSASFPNDIPSYYLNSPVYQYSLETDCNEQLNFTTIASQNLGGPGFISGFLGNGSGKNSDIGEPLANISLVLVDVNGVAIEQTVTNADGYFIFENLICGSYEIWLDDALTDNNVAPLITIENSCVLEDAQFVLGEDNMLTMLNTTAISDLTEKSFVSVYPNPTKGNVIIDLNSNETNVEIKLIDISGKLISSNEYQNIQNIELDIDGASGVYFLEVVSENINEIVKLVKRD